MDNIQYTGEFPTFYDSGNKKTIVKMVNGKTESSKNYNKDGTLLSEFEYDVNCNITSIIMYDKNNNIVYTLEKDNNNNTIENIKLIYPKLKCKIINKELTGICEYNNKIDLVNNKIEIITFLHEYLKDNVYIKLVLLMKNSKNNCGNNVICNYENNKLNGEYIENNFNSWRNSCYIGELLFHTFNNIQKKTVYKDNIIIDTKYYNLDTNQIIMEYTKNNDKTFKHYYNFKDNNLDSVKKIEYFAECVIKYFTTKDLIKFNTTYLHFTNYNVKIIKINNNVVVYNVYNINKQMLCSKKISRTYGVNFSIKNIFPKTKQYETSIISKMFRY